MDIVGKCHMQAIHNSNLCINRSLDLCNICRKDNILDMIYKSFQMKLILQQSQRLIIEFIPKQGLLLQN
ncbi:unnamed protein product [Paramecium octaurelia]|uniref:Uncharacterized protein n=1 Tax=Paramecium octaurelia TaxID=43137 RepID=A0A8S1V2K8_PAROT|nr:unnamed protein product [Paramecium octaurelia]